MKIKGRDKSGKLVDLSISLHRNIHEEQEVAIGDYVYRLVDLREEYPFIIPFVTKDFIVIEAIDMNQMIETITKLIKCNQ